MDHPIREFSLILIEYKSSQLPISLTHKKTYFHNFPSDLLSSEFCKVGYCLDITRLAACAQTINAFIGRLM